MSDQSGDQWDQVWADEGGIQVRVARVDHGGVAITIYDTSGRENRVLATATIAGYRWERILKAIGPDARPGGRAVKPSRSWDHRATPIPADEIERVRGQREAYKRHSWYQRDPIRFDPLRCSRRCPNEVTTQVTYRYVTGRAGRVTTARRRLCQEHAMKFIGQNADRAADSGK